MTVPTYNEAPDSEDMVAVAPTEYQPVLPYFRILVGKDGDGGDVGDGGDGGGNGDDDLDGGALFDLLPSIWDLKRECMNQIEDLISSRKIGFLSLARLLPGLPCFPWSKS